MTKKGRMRQRKPPVKLRSNKPLEKLYAKYFTPSRTALDERTGGSLEQPSPFKTVPSVVHYGVSQPNLLGCGDA
jgi:hypothetical protein